MPRNPDIPITTQTIYIGVIVPIHCLLLPDLATVASNGLVSNRRNDIDLWYEIDNLVCNNYIKLSFVIAIYEYSPHHHQSI